MLLLKDRLFIAQTYKVCLIQTVEAAHVHGVLDEWLFWVSDIYVRVSHSLQDYTIILLLLN